MKKKLIALLCTILFSFSYTIPSQASQLFTTNDSAIETYADQFVWRYKVINGRLYKRLYNTSTDSWVGNWILA